jgi:hypothetical protein
MCRGKAEVWDEPEESRCREAAVLAEDDWGCSAERMSIREFCRQRRVKESQFYWWQRKLKAGRQERNKPSVQDRAASFALVSEGGMDMPAGLELVLQDGRRLRISQGVQEETLRAVLAAMESGNK